MTVCPNCHAELSTNGKFCRFCGSRLPTVNVSVPKETSVSASTHDMSPEPTFSEGKEPVCQHLQSVLQSIDRTQSASQRLEELNQEQKTIGDRWGKQLSPLFDQIQQFLNSPSTRRFIETLISMSRGRLSLSKDGRILLLDGKRPAIPSYTYRDCQRLATQARAYFNEVSRRPQHDATLWQFCTGYVLLTDMVVRRRALLEEANRVELGRINQEIENLKGQCQSVSTDSIQQAIQQVEQAPDTLILGYWKDAVSKNVDDVPLALECAKGFGACFIEMPDIATNFTGLLTFLRGLFHKNCLRFAPDGLQFAMIEGADLQEKPLGRLAEYIGTLARDKPYFRTYLYDPVASTRQQINSMLDRIKHELNGRQVRPTTEPGNFRIATYNNKNPLNPLRYIVLLINGFPNVDIHSESWDTLCTILRDGATYGIFSIVIGQNRPISFGHETREALPISNCSMEVYPYEQYNWISFGQTQEIEIIKRLIRKASRVSLPLSELREHVSNDPTPVGIQVTIPVGMADGSVYSFATSTDMSNSPLEVGPHSMVIGGTGSGKTAFVHTLIFSAAMSYSPDELEFYIVDFRAENATAAYAGYMYHEGEQNLYLPHIRCLVGGRDDGRPEEVLQMIHAIHDERTKLMRQAGVQDFSSYHSSTYVQEQIKQGKLPAMPQIYFIIDEYNQVFDTNISDIVSSHRCEELQKCLNTVRTSGIGIILVGQLKTLSRDSMAQIFNRIAFGMQQRGAFNELFGSGSMDDEIDAFRETSGRVGYAACVRSAEAKKSIVRMAYVSDSEKQRLAEEIRQKYGNRVMKQTVPGEETAVDADGYPHLGEVISENEPSATGFCSAFPVGVSSLMGKPLSIVFEQQKQVDASLPGLESEYYNFLLIDTPVKQSWIELNLTLAFLYEHARRGIRFMKPHVYFSCMGEEPSMFIQTIQKQNLTKEIVWRKGLREILETILQMGDLFNRRWQEKLTTAGGGWVPSLFIFHNTSDWLDNLKRSLDALRQEAQEQKKQVANSTAQQKNSVVAKELETALSAAKQLPGIENLPGGILENISKFTPTVEKDDRPGKKVEEYRDTEILRILKDVLKDGSRVGIYVVFSGNSNTILETLEVNRIDKNFRSIIRSNGGKQNCCYLRQCENGARLFSYSKATTWWNSFRELYNRATPFQEKSEV